MTEEDAAEAIEMTCPRCGSARSRAATFCGVCGQDLRSGAMRRAAAPAAEAVRRRGPQVRTAAARRSGRGRRVGQAAATAAAGRTRRRHLSDARPDGPGPRTLLPGSQTRLPKEKPVPSRAGGRAQGRHDPLVLRALSRHRSTATRTSSASCRPPVAPGTAGDGVGSSSWPPRSSAALAAALAGSWFFVLLSQRHHRAGRQRSSTGAAPQATPRPTRDADADHPRRASPTRSRSPPACCSRRMRSARPRSTPLRTDALAGGAAGPGRARDGGHGGHRRCRGRACRRSGSSRQTRGARGGLAGPLRHRARRPGARWLRLPTDAEGAEGCGPRLDETRPLARPLARGAGRVGRDVSRRRPASSAVSAGSRLRRQRPCWSDAILAPREPSTDDQPGAPARADAVRRRRRREPACPLVARPVAFEAIPRAAWDRLLAATPAATAFSRWTVHRAWWDAYGSTAHEQYLVCVAADAPAGAELDADRHPRPSCRSCTATRSSRRTPRRPPDCATATRRLAPVRPTPRRSSWRQLPRRLRHDPGRADRPRAASPRRSSDALAARPGRRPTATTEWDVIDLRRLRHDDPALPALQRAFERRSAREGWQVIARAGGRLPGRDAARRRRLGDVPRHARQEGPPRDPAQDPPRRGGRRERRSELVDPTPEAVDAFIDLHQARWGDEGLFPATAGGDRSRRFIHRLAELELRRGRRSPAPARPLRGRRPGRHDSPSASTTGATCFFYNAGIDPDARDLSPGVTGHRCLPPRPPGGRPPALRLPARRRALQVRVGRRRRARSTACSWSVRRCQLSHVTDR